jgi:3-phenylpropionate/trans-cinnamate dioxygenase ferredoxin reductase subunit
VSERETYAIVGAGLAGARAAEALRGAGFGGRIVLIGAEPDLPYDRPPLSKEVLTGAMPPERTLLRSAEEWAADDVELLLGTRVTRLLPAERRLLLAEATGTTGSLRVDKVLFATGGRPRRLAVPGADLDGVYHFRTLADALAVRPHLVPDAPIVVVGAGFIGAEVAACARQAGCRVTVLEIADVPLRRVLGAEMGARYARYHRERGVDLRLGVGVDRIEGDDRVRAVVATDGTRIETSCVIVGIGIEPDLAVAAEAGIATGDGILVDEHCRTSLENVYAAGDVANAPNPYLGRRVRLENWQNAQNQGIAAGRSMTGAAEPYAEVPWFWSDQFDLRLQLAGHISPGHEVVYRGDPDSTSFCAFYHRDGVLHGALGLNRPREIRAAMRLIARRTRVDVDALAEEGRDLRKLATVPA